jgi:NTE family protein
MKTIGLVLSGGGARGAYQVGVLSAIAEISRDLGLAHPFKVYTGVSAGAINTAFLAAGSEDFYQTTQDLVKMWSQLTTDQVFFTDPVSLGRIGLKWIQELSVGRFRGNVADRSLLDTKPLGELLAHNIDFSQIQRNIDSGKLRAAAVTAMDYQTSSGVTFVHGVQGIKMWSRPRRHSEKVEIKAEHVMASSAIPLLFPPTQVGMAFYGDGCIRNQSPCGPAIDLGAQKLIVIGVRKSADVLELDIHQPKSETIRPPSVARVMNVLLNAVMLDGIEVDLERMDYINKISEQFQTNKNKSLRKIDYCLISPTIDIAKLAQENSQKLPHLIRYSIRALGSLQDAKEIISYLLFEPEFCTKLIEMGYADGLAQKENIQRCLLE